MLRGRGHVSAAHDVRVWLRRWRVSCRVRSREFAGVPHGGSPAALVPLAAFASGTIGCQGVSLDQAMPDEVSPELVINGYQIKPISDFNVISFYGISARCTARHARFGAGFAQEFGVFDPETVDQVGTCKALVSTTDSFVLGSGCAFRRNIRHRIDPWCRSRAPPRIPGR